MQSDKYAKRREFVRDYLSPMVAAAKNGPNTKWILEFCLGEEIIARYDPPQYEHIISGDEYVVAAVSQNDAADKDPYRYYINVSMDSMSAIAYDVMKKLLYK